MFHRWLFWPLFAAIMGFALGGSFVSSLQQPVLNQDGNWYGIFLNHIPDWFVAIFTGLLVYVTYRLVKSTNKLWEAGERQLELIAANAADQSRDMKASISAARDSADAAIAAKGAERTWVTFEAVKFHDEVNCTINDIFYESAIGVTVQWKNSGRSPALCLEIAMGAQVVAFGGADCKPFNAPDWTDSKASVPLGPNGIAGGPILHIFGEEYVLLLAKNKSLILYSPVRYFDIFNPTIFRTSEVCIKVDAAGYIQSNGRTIPNFEIQVFGLQNTAT